jgi:hypothetical protein
MMIPTVRKPNPCTLLDPKFSQTDVKNYVEANETPEDFLDIITFDVMRSPVQVAQTGQIYDRQSFAKWSDNCLTKGASFGGVTDPKTNIALGFNVKLKRVPHLEKSLLAFRAAINTELARLGQPLLEEPAAVTDGLSRGCWLGCLAACFGAD